MDGVRNYLASLIVAAFLCAVIRMIFSEKHTAAVCSLACGLLMIIAALRPVFRLDMQDLSRAISKFRLEEFSSVTEIKPPNNEIAADIIKEKTEAYIWDKAKQLQFTPESVSVGVDRVGQVPFPVRAEITGKYTQQQRIDLTLWIEQNLAIGKSSQKWVWK